MKRLAFAILLVSTALGIPSAAPPAAVSFASLDAVTQAPQPSPEPPDPVDPIPTNDPEALWPRWMPEIVFQLVNEPTSGPEVALTGGARDFAVDRRGAVHLAWHLGAQNGNQVVGYSNSRWENRDINSSGPVFKVRVALPGSIHPDVRIAVAPSGDVAVAWRESGADDGEYDLYVRRRLAGEWEPFAAKVADGNVQGTKITRFGPPSIAYDPQGGLHLAVGRQVVDGPNEETAVLYSKNLGAFAELEIGTVFEEGVFVGPFPIFEIAPAVAGDSAGQGHVLWTRSDDLLRYRPGAGAVTVDAIAPSVTPLFALALDRDDRAHIAYIRDAQLKYVRYGGAIETVPIQGTNPTFPGIDVDAAQEPVVLYQDSLGVGFATKVDNPLVVDPNRWAVQSPIAILAPFGSTDLDPKVRVGCAAGTVHAFVGVGSYTRTIEFNRGAQDPFLMTPVAPGFAANAGNGNLFGTFPLFASRGSGFSVAFSLVHNTLDSDATPLSPGWSHNYQIELTWHWLPREQNPPFTDTFAARISPISLRLGDGRLLVFRWHPDYDYWVPKDEFGYFSRIEIDQPAPGQFLMTTKFGVKYVFTDRGRLDRMEDTQTEPNTMGFEYGDNPNSPDEDATLLRIFDSMNREAKLEYDAENRLSKVTDPANATYTLEYDADGRLRRVKFDAAPLPTAWKFEYHADDNPAALHRKDFLARIFTPRGFFHEVFYQIDGRLRAVVEPDAGSLGEGSSPAPGPIKRVFSYLDTASAPQEVLVRDRRDQDTKILHERRRNLAIRVTDVLGNYVERAFDDFRSVLSFRDKRGFTTSYEYFPRAVGEEPFHVADNLGSIHRPGVPSPIEYTYTALNRVKTVRDARGATTTYDYFPTGNLKEIKYPPTTLADGSVENASESFEYDPRGRVESSKNARGFSTTFQYTDSVTGLVTKIFRPGGSQPEDFVYDVMGNTRFHTPPASGTTEFLLDGLYRVQFQTAPATSAGQHVTQLQFDADSNVILVSDNLSSKVAQHDYDALGRLVRTENAAGDAMEFSYDREGNTRLSRDFRGTLSATYYDALGRVREEVQDGSSTVGSGAIVHRQLFGYFPDGLLKSRTVVASPDRVTEHQYDARGNPVLTIHPIPSIRDQAEFDQNDNLTVSRRLDGTVVMNETRNDLDERNRLRETSQLHIESGEFFPTRFLFDPNGNRTKVIDPEGRSISFVFDKRDRQTRTLDHFGVAISETTYTEADLRESVRTLSPETDVLTTVRTFGYNARSELVTETDLFGHVVTNVHDVRGRLKERQEPGSVVSKWDYDALDRVQVETRAAGTSDQTQTVFGYDPNGNRTSITVWNPATQSSNATYQFRFDKANRMERLIYPPVPGLSGSQLLETWVYGAAGDLQGHTDRSGKGVAYQHDPLGREIAQTHGSPYFKRIEREYDGASNLRLVRERNGVSPTSPEEFAAERFHDSLSRLTDVTWTVDGQFFKSVSYSHERNGNRKTFVDPAGIVHTYQWDENNRPKSISREGGPTVSFGYFPGGQRRRAFLGDMGEIHYEYDSKERLRVLKVVTASGEARSHYRYHYNDRDNRNRVELLHLGVVVDYTYDNLDRLRSEAWTARNLVAPELFPSANVFASIAGGNHSPPSTEVSVTPKSPASELKAAYTAEYHFDPAGNRTKKVVNGVLTVYSHDAQNRLIEEETQGQGAILYDFDANGNQTTRTEGTKVETLGFDHENRLQSYVRTVLGAPEASFLYRFTATGERLAKLDLSGAEIATEWWMYDGSDVAADYTQAGAGPLVHRRSYLQGTSIDSKLARIAPDGTTHWYVPDALGSVHQVLGDDGQTRNMDLTTAWGEPLPSSTFSFANAVSDRHGFTSRERDGESSLMHFRARSYDPRLGRFVQTDPLGRRPELPVYAYVENDPVGSIDPLGLDRLDVIETNGEGLVFYVDEPGVRFSLVGWKDAPPVFVGTMKSPDRWNVYIKGKSGKEIPVPLAHVWAESDAGGTTSDWAAWADKQESTWSYSALTDPNRNLGLRARFLGGDAYSFNTEKFLGVKRFKQFTAELGLAAGGAFGAAIARWKAAGKLVSATRAAGVLHRAAPGGRTIFHYSYAKQVVQNTRGQFQAHHVLEARHLKNWGYTKKAIDEAPAVILTRRGHQNITQQLRQKLPFGKRHSRTEVWNAYRDAYRNHPDWLERVKPYFE